MPTSEEQRAKRRERYKRRKEWQATLKKWADFAADMAHRRIAERMEKTGHTEFGEYIRSLRPPD